MNECVNNQMQMVWKVIFEVIVIIFSPCELVCCYEHSSTIEFRVDKELIGLIDEFITLISHIHILFLKTTGIRNILHRNPSTSDLFSHSYIVES